ncbi:adventurous-gliding motility protein Z isoform X2 [Rhodamnia argentea]|uniref:Adventurous-gliding motility protein Z isoform X2 n=1 Tax=Rhodamnia argentea TaxID=178133 RepID=A0A8B8P7P9_9MYRT|nr:adventurous-gliding motility protein Z isoform X2 [Rhodamnia argentea]
MAVAGTDAQKQLLTLIRDFASEKSQGERRVADLRKQIEELRSALDAANAELEGTKLRRETAEQELKGYEVELAVNESAIQTLEARISTIQKEISTVRSDLQDLKSKDSESRDEFINKMFELNAKIRNFQKTALRDVGKEDIIGNLSEDSCLSVKEDVHRTADRALEYKLAHVITELTKEEEMLQVEQNMQKQVQQELIDLEMKVLSMEAIAKTTRDLQVLTRQSSQLEQKYSGLAGELQRRSMCPSCCQDNIEALEGSLHL